MRGCIALPRWLLLIFAWLDVSAATRAEWAWACAVGHRAWVADDALHGDLLFKLSDTGGLTLGLIGSEGVEDLLSLGGGIGVDGSGVKSTVVVDAIDSAENVAAIVLSSKLFILDFYGFPP